MTSKIARRLAGALALLVVGTACEKDLTDLEPADFPSIAPVFLDGFGPGVRYDAFQFSKVDALNIDTEVFFDGTASMRFDVPDSNDPSGGFVGGAFSGGSGRDLSGFNALTFWAKSNRTVDLDLVGLGIDFAGNTDFQTEVANLRLTSSWQQYVIPLPLASALTQEAGLFFLSEGNQLGDPYSIWIDELYYANLPSVGTPEAELFSRVVGMAVGDQIQAEISLTIPVGGEIISVRPSLKYFTWTSSNPSVATVSETGVITKVAEGNAQITASLGNNAIPGTVAVQDGLGVAGVVFDDAFGAGVTFEAFGGSKTDAVQIDDTEAYAGGRSLRIAIPVPTDPSGSYAGGAFTTDDLRDLSGSTALSFWAKAATPATLNVAGIGNDNTGNSRFVAERSTPMGLTTEWQQFVIPIPDPARLTAEGGLFFFAEGAENDQANTFWFDEIVYVDLDELGTVEPALVGGTVNLAVGGTTEVDYSISFPVGTETVAVSADARYFDWSSSDPSVATVSESGVVTMVAEGSADITATLGGVQAAGTVTVTTGGGTGGGGPPTQAAPVPTQDAADVISIYSDSYDDNPRVGLNLYGAADFAEVDVAGGNNALRYTRTAAQGGNFQVIELGGDNTIDAAAAGMTNFRFDLYLPEVDAGDAVLFKLVDIVPGGATSEALITVNGASSPAIAQGAWLSFDFDLATLLDLNGNPLNVTNVQQFVIDLLDPAVTVGDLYLDNIYFYDAGGSGGSGGAPTQAAPVPTQDAADVISIYSDSYTDNPRLGFNFYGAADFAEVDVAGGNNALRYTRTAAQGGNFQVLELGGDNVIDATAAGMTNFHFDVYFPQVDPADGALFKLVDIVPGGATSEALITVNAASSPAIAQGTWLSFDFDLATLLDLNGNPLNTTHVQQFVIDLLDEAVTVGELYLDNIYFYDAGGSGGSGGAPTQAAPVPTYDAADVISIYSDSYTDNPRLGFNFYGAADFAEVDVAGGNNALRYTRTAAQGGNFQVLELGGDNTIDAAAAGMTNFRFDLYLPQVDAGDQALFKLVDIVPGGATSESLIFVNGSSSPAIAQGTWLTFDFDLATLLDLNGNPLNVTNVQQFVIDLLGEAETVGDLYLDNILFYNAGGSGGSGGAPTQAAPVPTQDAADVISIYSDSYTDNPRLGFNFYGAADFAEVDVAGGNNALRYTRTAAQGGNFQVIELGGDNTIDAAAAGMTNFRFDLYLPQVDAGDQALFKLVDIVPGGATSESLIFVNGSSSPAIAQGTWLSFDFDLATLLDLNGNPLNVTNVQQFVIDLLGEAETVGEIYLDNIYFYNAGGSGGSGGAPTQAAPVPTYDAADVVSIYSDSYTDNPRLGFNFYGAADFAEVDVAGGNNALRYTRTAAQGGNFQVIELGGDNTIDAAAAGMTNFRFDLYLPQVDAGDQALFKLVDIVPGGATSESLIFVNGSSSPAIAQGSWLTFDFDLATLLDLNGNPLNVTNVQQFVIDLLGEAETVGDLYLDNILFYNAGGSGGSGGAINLPITFNDGAVTEADLIDFEGGGPSTLITDPTDGSNTVVQTVKSATAGAFAGVTMTGADGLGTAIPFTATSTTMTVRVYSPDTGIEVRLKVEENGDPTRSVETGATTTVANGWETLTFDFSTQTGGTAPLNLAYVYDKVSIFFNIGTDGATAGAKTYLWDDVTFVN